MYLSACPTFLFLLLLHHSLIFDDVEGHLYKANKGEKLTGQLLETHTVRSEINCASVCLVNEDCWSFNYMGDSHVCELNGGLQEPVTIEDENADLYGKIIL